MSILHDWVLSLTAAALVASLAVQLTPKGGVRTVTGFISGIVLLIVLIEPLWRIDTDILFGSIGHYRASVSELTASLEEQEKELLRTYIEEKYAAYILDEAHVLGVETARVRIRVKWGDGSWVPNEAYMDMDAPEELKARLTDSLMSELGIPKERQHWNESK